MVHANQNIKLTASLALVRTISAVVVCVTLQGQADAQAVVTSELARVTCLGCCMLEPCHKKIHSK